MDTTTNDKIARLRAWMEEQALDQKRLAENTGFSTSAISRFLSGERPITGDFELAFLQRFGLEAGETALGLEFAQ